MTATFSTAGRIITGAGSLTSIGEEAKALGKRALQSGSTTANPQKVTPEDLQKILHQVSGCSPPE